MSNQSNDNEVGQNPLDELRELLSELSDELSQNERQKIFKMAEFLLALDVRTEACQIQMSSGKSMLGLVITIDQFNNLRKALVQQAL
jgi:hypothetical protein